MAFADYLNVTCFKMCIWQKFLCVAGLALSASAGSDPPSILEAPHRPRHAHFFTFFSFINKNCRLGYTYDYHTLKCCTKKENSLETGSTFSPK